MGLLVSGSLEPVVRLITLLLIFGLVLFLTFWTSKFVGGYQKQKMMTGNMEVVETLRIAQNKYLQIVRAGEQYFVLAIGKDTVSTVGQLNPEELNLKKDTEALAPYDFKAILEKAKNSRKKQESDNE